MFEIIKYLGFERFKCQWLNVGNSKVYKWLRVRGFENWNVSTCEIIEVWFFLNKLQVLDHLNLLIIVSFKLLDYSNVYSFKHLRWGKFHFRRLAVITRSVSTGSSRVFPNCVEYLIQTSPLPCRILPVSSCGHRHSLGEIPL